MAIKLDKELLEFRDMLQVPTKFEDGFNWTAFFAAIFVALLIVPGSIYMGLIAGAGMGDLARWVTVIMFLEVARRAQTQLSKAEIFVLSMMASGVAASEFSGLHWNQFFIRSQAAQAYGIVKDIPAWFAPQPGSSSYALRTFLHADWLPVIGMLVFNSFVSELSSLILGYGFFRLTSDIEKLPFPTAPAGAQGILALAEDTTDYDEQGNIIDKKVNTWRWRCFSIGGALGMLFGAVYYVLPTITGALLGTPIAIFQLPFTDFTYLTSKVIPAVATGITWDLGQVITGMVLPFWSVLGAVFGLLFTCIANPMLYRARILSSWTYGDDLILTGYKNTIDFYYSFGLGLTFAIALYGFYQVYISLKASKIKKEDRQATYTDDPIKLKARGDIPVWVILSTYFAVTMSYILLSGYLIHWHTGVMIVLVVMGFVYTPLISYVTARLQGICGLSVGIPSINDASIILSGYRGVAVWFLPIPISNYGSMATFYRQSELLGTKFGSIWKTRVFLFPITIISTIVFASFIWSLAEIPSAVYPQAQRFWEISAAQRCIVLTSTTGEFSLFEHAFRASYLLWGLGAGLFMFAALTTFGIPITGVYGAVNGLAGGIPFNIIPMVIGALIGKYVLRKRFGDKNYLKYMVTVSAGFGLGMALISALGVGVTFLSKAVIQLPF